MNYSAINIHGNILSSEVLEKIRTEDIRFQNAKDFTLDPGASVRDEISLAWALTVSHWKAFKQKREALSVTDTGTTETRNYWIKPFMGILGYELAASSAETINGKSYAISFRANNLDQFPVHIVGINQSLDTRAEAGGPRLSPHALAQEYLNNQEHLYALVSNGKFLRVLRDATRLSRLSYIEFNLEQMMEENLYAEFALLFRVLHASRMPQKMDAGSESILEFYHQEALASGSRIRERLSLAVESSIKELANGFLKHNSNERLKTVIAENKISPNEYYLYNLRIVYRLLFLMVIEERKLIYPATRDELLEQQRTIYYNYYSIQRLCKLVEKMVYVEPTKTDLWQSLVTCFTLFEQTKYGKELGIAPLGSGLFAPDALGILEEQALDNETLLKVLRNLVTFENEKGQRVRVNYADLDVEEFGSVYEGLLEYEPQIQNPTTQPIFLFKEGNERSKSGSHYTPEELVKPLIQHSLDYLIQDKLKEKDPQAALLSLKVCDVACGSGHILLSAARRIGFELAKLRSKEDQPSPTFLRQAIRETITHCIYGVDKNPLAVELCKVALWLEAHNPGHPLNFLDHHIKCGDAIVGLAHRSELEKGIADEAFKTFAVDDKVIAKSFRDKNIKERKVRTSTGAGLQLSTEEQLVTSVQEAIAEYKTFNQLPETTPDEIERKAKAYKKFIDGKGFTFLKAMADTQVAQFFIPKTEANKDYLMTDADFRLILSGYKGWQLPQTAKAKVVAEEQRFFHWFIEFPEVFNEGGFDTILGNPPYLGGTKISTNYGIHFSYYLLSSFSNTSGLADLVTYFIKRITSLLKSNAFFNIITTDSVSQGATRLSALEELLNNGSIIFAIKTMRWPGTAAVNVALIGFYKGKWKKELFLNGQKVEFVNSLLGEADEDNNTNELYVNHNKSYTGSKVYGEGFVLTKEKANELLSLDSKNEKVIKPYLTGDDIANEIGAAPSRFVINFQGWPLDRYSKKEWLELSVVLKNEINDRVFNNKPILNAPHWYGDYCARDFPAILKIIEKEVKPEREKVKGDVNAQKYWWIYQRVRKEMYDAISLNKNIIVLAQTAKYILPTFTTNDKVHSVKVIVITDESSTQFALLANSLYNEWCWKFGTTMGSSTLQYSTSQCFDSYPFPQKLISKLETIGEAYHEHRRKLMLAIHLGLTKTYNLFHSNAITAQIINDKDKQVASLRKHLEKTANTISFDDAIKGILKLRELHVQMDEAVLDAYGWNDIALKHDFYGVDYLPENDRVRFTIHHDARKEVLKRLLELNHKIHAEEVAAGLWDKKGGKKIYKIADEEASRVDEPDENIGGLFNQQ